jgi:hypothetical protein
MAPRKLIKEIKMTTTYQAQEQILRDLVLVVNQLVRRQERQGVRLPDEIGAAMTRLVDGLLTEQERSAKRLEELQMKRSKLVVRRGELAGLRRQQDWLLANAEDQPPTLIRQTKETAKRTAAEHATCLKQLAGVEAEIAATATKAAPREFLR